MKKILFSIIFLLLFNSVFAAIVIDQTPQNAAPQYQDVIEQLRMLQGQLNTIQNNTDSNVLAKMIILNDQVLRERNNAALLELIVAGACLIGLFWGIYFYYKGKKVL